MIYRISLPSIENAFYNCRISVSDEIRSVSGGWAAGREIENLFETKHGIRLIRIKNNNYTTGKATWGWSDLEFENEEQFVLFMLIWS